MTQRNAARRVDAAHALAGSERRRSSRVPVPGMIVAAELAEPVTTAPVDGARAPGPVSPTWAGSAIDISRDGLGLVLPAEVPVGTELLLTFKLDDDTTFARVPSAVVRTQPGLGLGAVRFEGWNHSELRALHSYLGPR